MKIVKIILIILSAGSIFLGQRYYKWTSITLISPDMLDKPPYYLAKNNVLYFDNFQDKELNKYRQFLKEQQIDSINGTNNKVLFIMNFINNAYNSGVATALAKYPEYVVIKGPQAYCQKASILLSLMLSSTSIYSRHWHAAYQNNKGYHQFIEYYNPEENKWVAADIFYGIQYRKNGELLSVSEVAKFISEEGGIDRIISLLKTRLYFTPGRDPGYQSKRIENIWSNKLLLARANDYTKQGTAEIKYGVWSNLPFFNQLSTGLKKPFRVFGRNNSLYELINFKKT